MMCVIDECLYCDLKDNCTKRAPILIPNNIKCPELMVALRRTKERINPDIDYRLSRTRE